MPLDKYLKFLKIFVEKFKNMEVLMNNIKVLMISESFFFGKSLKSFLYAEKFPILFEISAIF